jgi:hypothetical protein
VNARLRFCALLTLHWCSISSVMAVRTWGAPIDDTEQVKVMRVDIEIFSGRPNPSWTLTAKESADFLALLRKLPKSKAGPIPDGLGYRGLKVSGLHDTVPGASTITVYNGVAVIRNTIEESHEDKGRALERWLLQTGKTRIDKNIFEQVKRDVGPD